MCVCEREREREREIKAKSYEVNTRKMVCTYRDKLALFGIN